MKKVVECSSTPPAFNYDTSWSVSKPWKKPKKFIEVVLTTRTLASDDNPQDQKQAASKRTREPLLSRVASGQNVAKLENHVLAPSPQDVGANHQVALLKLRYLHLRKQLALLRQGSLESIPDASHSNVLTFSVNSGGIVLTDPSVNCLASIRKTTRFNAGVRKKKLDEL